MSCFILLLNIFIGLLTILKLFLEILKLLNDKKRNVHGGHRKRKK